MKGSIPPLFTNEQLNEMESNPTQEALLNIIKALRQSNNNSNTTTTTTSKSSQNRNRIINIKWVNIGHAISHELYEQISSWFMLIIKNHKIKDDQIFHPDTIKFILAKLKARRKIDNKEIEYIDNIIKRARIYANSQSKHSQNSMYFFYEIERICVTFNNYIP